MKTIRLLALGGVVLGAFGAGYFFHLYTAAGSAPAGPATSDTDAAIPADELVVAHINGEPVTHAELIPYFNEVASTEQLMQWRKLSAVPRDVYEAALVELAQDRLVRAAADEAALTQRPKIRALMTKSANRIAKLAYLDQLAHGLVDDAGIRRRYDELAASLQGKKEYRARHILLKDEQEARTMLKALDSRPFEELAKLFSLDEHTGLRGGDLGYFLAGSLDAQFEANVTGLKPGAVSAPFQTRFGWHIAVLDDVRDATPMDFEQAAPIIRRELEEQARQAWLDELVAKSEIQTQPVGSRPESEAAAGN